MAKDAKLAMLAGLKIVEADHGLAEFGYVQRLDRSIGKFASFAAGVSYISILTGVFELFYFGYGIGGPAYAWSWPLVFVGQLMVALCFMELAAHYPVAGSVYNWAKALGERVVGWSAGWLMLTSSIVTLAAVTLALQLSLPKLWAGFQLVGSAENPVDRAENAALLGVAAIALTTAINMAGVRLMSFINSVGVAVELFAAVAIVVVLAANAVRGPSVFFSTHGDGATESGGYLGGFLIASLASGYVMYGFDTASSLGEETVNPRRTAPAAIFRAVLASFVIGGGILVFAIMAAPRLDDPLLGSPDGGLHYLVGQVLQGPLGKAFLCSVVLAVFVCALAVHTAGIRTAFAMARDNALPFGEKLAVVHPRWGTPVVPALVIGVVAALILLVNIGQPQIFTVVTSIAVLMIYLAYLLVTAPMLVQRLRGQWPKQQNRKKYFHMGRWGLVVNILAVLWGVGMAVNLAWPREEVYGASWYNTWGAFLYIGVILGSGLVWLYGWGRRHIGVIAAHSEPKRVPA
ncbi:amino acid permease-associated region [Segniliparus rotundus DSM 44985]|uniref:Amino acid permease-associated region n=1 Tax=Segniliparus rotundus (strain ATCC BAA-972 / CDC 1076 / CIP 108378 / DSM 44985 / JCM 13578) TaxID=640132 RepID=D6ZBG5_SEGRD|nr:APC family permease [Segniliparus rotundus]ADG98917.1 amino acid permease-associated region [Segniliparus rotundus DSM 44985]